MRTTAQQTLTLQQQDEYYCRQECSGPHSQDQRRQNAWLCPAMRIWRACHRWKPAREGATLTSSCAASSCAASSGSASPSAGAAPVTSSALANRLNTRSKSSYGFACASCAPHACFGSG